MWGGDTPNARHRDGTPNTYNDMTPSAALASEERCFSICRLLRRQRSCLRDRPEGQCFAATHVVLHGPRAQRLGAMGAMRVRSFAHVPGPNRVCGSI